MKKFFTGLCVALMLLASISHAKSIDVLAECQDLLITWSDAKILAYNESGCIAEIGKTWYQLDIDGTMTTIDPEAYYMDYNRFSETFDHRVNLIVEITDPQDLDLLDPTIKQEILRDLPLEHFSFSCATFNAHEQHWFACY